MIVEILGAKMLAPYFGTSHFVWTAQIAVTLVALAAGYYLGGRLVDRSTQLGRIYGSILAAAIYLVLAVLAVEPVAYGCLRFKLAVGSLLASVFLFFIPLALLAMVGPFFIRVLTISVAGVGGNVGRLSAISTLGSFAGTLLIGYALIPFLPNSITMLLTSGLLMAVAAGYFFTWGRGKAAAVSAALVLGLALGIYAGYRVNRPHFEHVVELARSNSNFGLLQVLQEKDGPRRYYLNDYLTQNIYDADENKSTAMFTYMLYHLARAYTPSIQDVLCIGLGVGIVPMDFARDGVRVEVVEINPAVVPLARQFFGLEPQRLKLHFGDGRYFLNQAGNRYDTVILDAFLGDSSPSHLMTREAFSAIRRALKPGGTLVINSFGDFNLGHDFFTASLYRTLTNVFASVRIHCESDQGNTFFVASDQPNLAILHPPDFSDVHSYCLNTVRAAFDGLREPLPGHGRVLTDDYNPVEFYDAANRETIRRYLAKHARAL